MRITKKKDHLLNHSEPDHQNKSPQIGASMHKQKWSSTFAELKTAFNLWHSMDNNPSKQPHQTDLRSEDFVQLIKKVKTQLKDF